MMKQTIAFFCCLALAFPALAQFTDMDPMTVNTFKGKILMVVLQEETTASLLKYRPDDEKFNNYRQGVANYNAMVERAARAVWQTGKGIEFLPESKARELIKKNNSKYVYVFFVPRKGTFPEERLGEFYGDGVEQNTEWRNKTIEATGWGTVHFQMARGGEGNTIYTVHLPSALPSEGDVMYALGMAQLQVATKLKERTYELKNFEADVKKNNKRLQTRTVLVSTEQLDPKSSLQDLTAAYTYPIDVVDYSEVNRALIEQDTNFAVVYIVPMTDYQDEEQRTVLRIMHLVVEPGAIPRVLGRYEVSRTEFGQHPLTVSKKEAKAYRR